MVAEWFKRTYPDFTQAQRLCVPAILEGKSVLLSSPTGSGKTLAGFLGIIDWLVREQPPAGHIYAIYVSPLRALTYDIQKNLTRPLQEMGLEDSIRVGLRTGDTPAKERAALRRKPPHILLTTPESLAILLCQPAYHEALRTVRFVVVDELHALAENKRGTHLSVSLERLERLKQREPKVGEGAEAVVLRKVGGGSEERMVLGGGVRVTGQVRSLAELGNEGKGEGSGAKWEGARLHAAGGAPALQTEGAGATGGDTWVHAATGPVALQSDTKARKLAGAGMESAEMEKFCRTPLCRVGLSATIAPLEAMAGFLAGVGRPCLIAEARMERKAVVEVFSPVRREPYPPAGQSAGRVLQELAALVRSRRSVLIFTNTRAGAETFGLRLKAALPKLADRVEIHHSSLDRNVRLEVEDRLKNGELRAVVCSTSLEMGVDIGAIDLVVMISAPKGISRTLQRIGRSGHSVNAVSHGILVATNVNDLVECAVTARLARERRLDAVRMPECPADVLAQHLLGLAIEAPGVPVEEAWDTVRGAWPYRELQREEFDGVVRYLEGGGKSLEKAYADTFGKLRVVEGRMFPATPRVARDYLVNVGTISSQGLVDVLLRRRRLGTVEEGFIKGLKVGDVFVLGGRVVRLVEAGWQVAKVEAADGERPNVPLWSGGKMALTSGLSVEIGSLRTELNRRLTTEDTENTEEEKGEGGDRGSVKRAGEAAVDYLVEDWELSAANAQAVVAHFRLQRRFSVVPNDGMLLIELHRERGDERRTHYFFHSLIGRGANDALSRIVAWRVAKLAGGNALATVDDYGFLLTLNRFQELSLEQWRECFARGGAEEDLRAALKESELVRWQFRGVAQTGLMVPRQLPGKERKLKQLRFSAEILFRVLEQHEPTHPMLAEAYRQALTRFLDVEAAAAYLESVRRAEWDWRLVETPTVSPFAFPLYVSLRKEAMMFENPEEAVERMYREFYGGEDAG